MWYPKTYKNTYRTIKRRHEYLGLFFHTNVPLEWSSYLTVVDKVEGKKNKVPM